MPVFTRYRIDRYKEILTTQQAGLISDGQFSTYTLDDPAVNPNGNGDFLGVIKTAVLLADVYLEILDTKNFSFVEFNNLTQQEFDNYVSNGLFSYFQTERIGWVEIGRTNASFYYETCPNGKRPVSEHYYDIQEFAFSDKLVFGEGSEVEPTEALRQIGNFDQNIANNMGILRPRFNPLSLQEYIRFSINGSIVNTTGESVNISQVFYGNQKTPSRVSLLMANKAEHFDNQFATEISPGKWGTIRRTIEESFKPSIYTIYPQSISSTIIDQTYQIDFSINRGQCLATSIVPSTGLGGVVIDGGVITSTPVTGGPTLPPLLINEEDITPNNSIIRVPWDFGKVDRSVRDVDVTRDYIEKTCFSLIHDFPLSLLERFVFSENSIDLSRLGGLISTGNSRYGVLSSTELSIIASRLRYQLMSLLRGEIPYISSDIPDLLETVDLPRGTIRKEINPETGCIELTYTGTPVTDYVGPTLFEPTEFGLDETDEPTPLILDINSSVRIDTRGRPTMKFSDSELYWMKRRGSTGAPGGTGWWDRSSGSPYGTNKRDVLANGRYIEMIENETPVYMFASDQIWKENVKETKSVTVQNRGGTPIIITDYTPRGCANFINIGLLNALPVVLLPGEVLEFTVDYIPRRTGLQSWKGDNDPFPALMTKAEPNNFIIIEYIAYARLPQLGYVPIREIPDDRRPNKRWQISKRNKLWSKLEIEVGGNT